VASFSEDHIATLLGYHLEWMRHAQDLTPDAGRWLYALLAALDHLLDADTTATLRDILRHCAQLRSHVVLILRIH
jgi:survival of motor neuron protein-interacting protein 1